MLMTLDPFYWLLIGPTIALALYAQMKVKSSFARYSKVPATAGISGAQAARRMLHASGLDAVAIERVGGVLSDHYDPRKRVLRLSPQVHDGTSIASLGVACHEAGHAIQHARNYAPLVVRNAVVPVAGFGSWIAWPMIIFGMLLQMKGLATLGVILFGALVLFQVVNLPVEFNASARAKEMLASLGMIHGQGEARAVSAVLGAAALTYVAATAQAVMQLLYFAIQLGLLGGRDD